MVKEVFAEKGAFGQIFGGEGGSHAGIGASQIEGTKCSKALRWECVWQV